MTELWIPSKAIAACIGLLGFAVAVMSGLMSGASADGIVLRAVLAMLGCVALGRLIAWATRLCLEERLEQYIEANPVPNSSGVNGGLRGVVEENGVDGAESAG